jgi:hypothetical protein
MTSMEITKAMRLGVNGNTSAGMEKYAMVSATGENTCHRFSQTATRIWMTLIALTCIVTSVVMMVCLTASLLSRVSWRVS